MSKACSYLTTLYVGRHAYNAFFKLLLYSYFITCWHSSKIVYFLFNSINVKYINHVNALCIAVCQLPLPIPRTICNCSGELFFESSLLQTLTKHSFGWFGFPKLLECCQLNVLFKCVWRTVLELYCRILSCEKYAEKKEIYIIFLMLLLYCGDTEACLIVLLNMLIYLLQQWSSQASAMSAYQMQLVHPTQQSVHLRHKTCYCTDTD